MLRKLGWKAKLLLGLIKLATVFAVAWYAMPALTATYDHLRQDGKEELASIGTINSGYIQFMMSEPQRYGYGELEDMMSGNAPQYPRWPFISREATERLIAQVDKWAFEHKYDAQSEWDPTEEVAAWKVMMNSKLAAYMSKGQEKFGKAEQAITEQEYFRGKYTPQYDWTPWLNIAAKFLNALLVLLLGRFVYYMAKAKIEGFKLRFEWIPHRAPLAALLIGVDYFVDFYPSGSPSGQVKAMLGWTFSTLFSALVLFGSAGSVGAQSAGSSKQSKEKDPTTLQIDVRYGESFGDDPNIQKQIRLTLLGRESNPWLIESVTAVSPTAVTQTTTPGYAFKRRPFTFNVLGGFRAVISKRPAVKNSYSILGGTQFFYRKPGKYGVYIPSLSMEFQLRPVKRVIFNFNSSVLKEVKKFDFGTDITVRKPFDQSAQWTVGGVVGYKRNKSWPRIEFGVFRNWLQEIRWRIRMTYQLNL